MVIKYKITYESHAAAGAILADGMVAVQDLLAMIRLASLSGGRPPREDLTESAALGDWAEVLHRPYRIVLEGAGGESRISEPMKSDLVRSRIAATRRFFE